MKIFKYLYYMMLGVLVGCILMTVAGCKEEQKRDPNFIAKTESVNKDLEIIGTWQEAYYDEYGNVGYAVLEFNEDNLCVMSAKIDGKKILLATAEYKYSSGEHTLVFYNAILSQVMIDSLENQGQNSINQPGGIKYAEVRGGYLRLIYNDGTSHNFKNYYTA